MGSYGTAWSWLQNLRGCTVRKEREKLTGKVEAHEFYLVGEHSGKRGRGALHKCAVAIAVEHKGKKLGRLRVQVILERFKADLRKSIFKPIWMNIRSGSTGEIVNMLAKSFSASFSRPLSRQPDPINILWLRCLNRHWPISHLSETDNQIAKYENSGNN